DLAFSRQDACDCDDRRAERKHRRKCESLGLTTLDREMGQRVTRRAEQQRPMLVEESLGTPEEPGGADAGPTCELADVVGRLRVQRRNRCSGPGRRRKEINELDEQAYFL